MLKTKFRAWDIRAKKMVKVLNLKWFTFEGKEYTRVDCAANEKEYIPRINYDGHEREVELMQFIGCSDVKGRDAYEGDVIVSKHYPFYGDAPEITSSEGLCTELNYVGIIGFDMDGAYYELKPVSNRVRGGACGDNISILNGDFEIIGNVYQNTELLEIKQ